MKCPIKKLEEECIEQECPLYFCGCGLRGALMDVGEIESSIDSLESKIVDLTEVIEKGLKRR